MVRLYVPIADRIARAATKRSAGRVSFEDVQSFAWEALFLSVRDYDDRLGVPLEFWISWRVKRGVIDGLRAVGGRRRPGAEGAGFRPGAGRHVGDWADVGMDDGGLAVPIAAGEDAERAVVLAEERRHVLQSLRTLDERTQKLLWLMYFREMTVADAARQIGLSKSWGSRLARRALGQMRRTWRSVERASEGG